MLILQHPLETNNAKGSARLLHLSLPGSSLLVGEVFDTQTLQDMLYAPLLPDVGTEEQVRPILLYPDVVQESGRPSTSVQTNIGGMAMPPVSAAIRLVILDATWRKSRKMLYLNTLLQALPRLSLRDPPPSHYHIRKAHRPDQLSTLEATCHALSQLEGERDKYRPLLQSFDGFVGQQSAYATQS